MQVIIIVSSIGYVLMFLCHLALSSAMAQHSSFEFGDHVHYTRSGGFIVDAFVIGPKFVGFPLRQLCPKLSASSFHSALSECTPGFF